MYGICHRASGFGAGHGADPTEAPPAMEVRKLATAVNCSATLHLNTRADLSLNPETGPECSENPLEPRLSSPSLLHALVAREPRRVRASAACWLVARMNHDPTRATAATGASGVRPARAAYELLYRVSVCRVK